MKVLNPLFDSVFKYLLEDLEIAKMLIHAIIKKEILELTPAPQESSDIELKLKYSQIGMIRQDYVAIIKTLASDGGFTTEKVIIEVQKSPLAPEIGRFRNYLSDKYRKKSAVGSDEKYLPIKTIYIIEEIFNNDLPAVLGRKGIYFNELENTPYQGARDAMVELFNHDSWFIQTELLPHDFKEELMYVLSIFAPWFRKSPKDRFIEIPDDEILVKKHKILDRIFRRLQAATQDNKVNTSVDVEMDYENYIEKMVNLRELAEAKAESERIQREEAEAKAEFERIQREEAEAMAESERIQREEAEAKAEFERIQREEAEAKAEFERIQREEAEAKAEFERIQREEAEAKAEFERIQREEAEAKAEFERIRKEEAIIAEMEAKRKLAATMKKYGESIELIMQATGLSYEQIADL